MVPLYLILTTGSSLRSVRCCVTVSQTLCRASYTKNPTFCLLGIPYFLKYQIIASSVLFFKLAKTMLLTRSDRRPV